MKPTKEQFHAYLTVQYSGLTNMYDGNRVMELARDYKSEKLTTTMISYIMKNYSELKEEYGDISQDV